MTVTVTKPSVNLREELASLKKPSGIVGESILRADTAAEAVEQLNLEDHTFTTFTSTGIDDNATSTAMTLDSSGNLLVGKTAATISTDGAEMRPTGEVVATTNGLNVAYFNRRSSDGSIAEFRKDGAPVGSIGTTSGEIAIGSNTTGVRFTDAADRIDPWSITSNTARDGAIDLGTGTRRFKDLYLSGGVYLGGTGAANKLDDYESGTFTPTVGSGVTSPTYGTGYAHGFYVKVGRLVTFTLRMQLTGGTANSSQYQIHGLPFTSGASSASPYVSQGGASINYQAGFKASYDISLHVPATTTRLVAWKQSDGSSFLGTDATDVTKTLHINGHYFTA